MKTTQDKPSKTIRAEYEPRQKAARRTRKRKQRVSNGNRVYVDISTTWEG